ncbi:hypothetical protein [Nonomuraea sp. NPDC052265]
MTGATTPTARPTSLGRALPRRMRETLGTVHVLGPIRRYPPPAVVLRCR